MLRTSPIWKSASSSWIQTLRLPKSNFPARPDLGLRPQLLQSCTDHLYAWQSSARPAENTFTLHDGPPYANGGLHVGHALNKILKDIFNRFQLSQGRRIRYQPGWDCHGLPIELKVLQKYGQPFNGSTLEPTSIRNAARALAAETIEAQRDEFRSWAVMGEWEQPYTTMDEEYELKQLLVFRDMVSKGLICRQRKPVYWSPSSKTALAEAELEYNESYVSQAGYVKFRVTHLPASLHSLDRRMPVYALTWTTTPWTLPANKAIAVHPDLDYSIIAHNREYLIVGADRITDVAAVLRIKSENFTIPTLTIKGREIADRTMYINGFQGSHAVPQPILAADHVSSDTGTGLVHAAPGHGHDDYTLCAQHDIDAFSPIDDEGRFTADAMPDEPEALQGKFALMSGSNCVLDLMKSGKSILGSPLLVHRHEYTHKYPIDWRTKLPVIIRATAQWFANINDIKQRALQAIEDVEFIPAAGKSRLRNFVHGRGEWCISRQRSWGLPIPVLYYEVDGSVQSMMTPESISHIIQVMSERGSDAWWIDDEDDPQWIAPHLPLHKYIRGKDTMDVWFDSGTSWTQLNQATNQNGYLVDVYLEGSDQHRGWFQSSLLTYIASQVHTEATTDVAARAPFERLITHGFILDENGRKMSKSIGNVINPDQIVKGTLLPPVKLKGKMKRLSQQSEHPQHDALGVDALRLWVAKNDFRADVPIGAQVLRGVHSALHKYRVTLKWLLGVLSDYDSTQAAQAAQLSGSLDLSNRLALLHLTRVEQYVHAGFAAYEPYKAMRELERYVNVDLSSFYVETAKDAIYTSTANERLGALFVCNQLLQTMMVMLAAPTPLLVAEALHYASPAWYQLLETQNKHPFRRIWKPTTTYADRGSYELALHAQDQCVQAIRQAVNGAQEQLRSAKQIGSGLEASVAIRSSTMQADPMVKSFIEQATNNGELARALIVSEVQIDPGQGPEHGSGAQSIDCEVTIPDLSVRFILDVHRAEQLKCPRCWRFAINTKELVQPDYDEGRQTCSRCSEVLHQSRPPE
ncbi:MAG: hypothetical protein Q9159_005139 [Coniocarpon cinnabarinum]